MQTTVYSGDLSEELNSQNLFEKMQSKAYTKEIQPENRTVFMNIYHLFSDPRPELQWLSW